MRFMVRLRIDNNNINEIKKITTKQNKTNGSQYCVFSDNSSLYYGG